MKYPQLFCNKLKLFPGPRERLPGEIIPFDAELSRTNQDDEALYGAANFIDLDWETRAHATQVIMCY